MELKAMTVIQKVNYKQNQGFHPQTICLTLTNLSAVNHYTASQVPSYGFIKVVGITALAQESRGFVELQH